MNELLYYLLCLTDLLVNPTRKLATMVIRSLPPLKKTSGCSCYATASTWLWSQGIVVLLSCVVRTRWIWWAGVTLYIERQVMCWWCCWSMMQVILLDDATVCYVDGADDDFSIFLIILVCYDCCLYVLREWCWHVMYCGAAVALWRFWWWCEWCWWYWLMMLILLVDKQC